ncbi:hypothetical protein Y032_0270g850 [Ancylostoma ceylanicum]|uniref:Uncharacterized protein n=1 Tax=Ancylostoma ceylanicum TaxID=53326 RepID=A0A016S8I8_9BILA|nr:hypothetical protein Y032_0270g850 [Ancylostoma ceylanicum]
MQQVYVTTSTSPEVNVPARLGRKVKVGCDSFYGCEVVGVLSSRFCVDRYPDAGWIFALKREMPLAENAITGILIG